MLSTFLLVTQVSIAMPPAVAPDAGPTATRSTVDPAHMCETGPSAGIIVQGGKTANTGIIVQGGKTAGSGIIVQGGRTPSSGIIVQGGMAPISGIIVQGGKTAGSGIIVQGGLQPSAPSEPAAAEICEKPKL